MPDQHVAITILFSVFGVLLILRVPIAFTLAVASIATAAYLKIPLLIISQQMVRGVNSFALLAIPFFIISGELMGEGGISKRLIDFSNLIIGRLRGGLALVNVLASMFFGGISGSAVADASSIGSILIPMMKKKGYDTDYSVGVTITGACQGVLIPPSHNMIIYSVAAGGVSVGALFLAGFVPGVLLGISLMISSYIIAVRRNYPKGEKVTFKAALKCTRDAAWGLFTAVIIVGGVLGGIFTATESSAIACVYAFFVTFFIYREIPLSRLPKILYSSLKTLAMVMTLIGTANAFGYLLAYLKIPTYATNALLSVSDNKNVILLLINILLLGLGCIMDMAPLIVICTPILFPVMMKLHVDPVHFGIILILNLAIGLCTPPVGSALFVGCAIGKISMEQMTKALLPFFAAMVAVLMLVTYFPEIVLFIPNLVMPNR
jgi:tripartite ATP-independent transporter DctM subunit